MLAFHKAAKLAYRYKIGNRELVGPSFTGRDEYFDLIEVPCPPIRYKPPSAEIDALRQKEKSDWKSLSVDEKKKLYRASFCRTFAELDAPTAEGRRTFGDLMFILSIPITLYVILKNTVFPPLPESMSDLGKKKMVRFYLDNRVGDFSSKWDYEKQQWKEKPFLLMKKD